MTAANKGCVKIKGSKRSAVERASVSQKRFFSGMAALTISAVAVKIIGLFYKIPLLYLLGSEGMGYFNSAYEIYAMFFTISTAGIPIAVSINVASALALKDRAWAEKIFKMAIILLATVGIIGAAVMFFGAGVISEAIGNRGAENALQNIAPAALFVCISGAFKGYFQGFEDMKPTALSQILEALGKLVLGLGFAYVAVKVNGKTAEQGAAAAVCGLSIGCGIAMMFLLLQKCRTKKYMLGGYRSLNEISIEGKRKGIVASLLAIAFPVTLSSSVLSVTRIIDMTMILKKLQDLGMAEAEANVLFGNYMTMAVPLFSLPSSLIGAMALPLVPMIKAASEEKNRKKEAEVLESALRITTIMSIPASLGMMLFSQQILTLIFPMESAVNSIYTMLTVLGAGVFFSCMVSVTNAVLQAYGKQNIPLISMSIGAIVKLVSSYILVSLEEIRALGIPISTLLFGLVVTVINYACITRVSDALPKTTGGTIGRTLASSVAAVVVAAAVLVLTQSVVALLISAVVSYLFFALLTGAIEKKDLFLLPGADKISRMLRKSENEKIIGQ